MGNMTGTSSTQVKVQQRKSSMPATDYGKLPPQAIELEELVLGAIMIDKNAISTVMEILRPESFYLDKHQLIYKAMISLFNKSMPVDVLMVVEELKLMGKLEEAGGAFYLSKLTMSVASSANVEFHARIIAQKYIQRELIRIASQLITEAYEDTTDVYELMDKAERELFGVTETNLRRNYEEIGSVLTEAVKSLEIKMQRDEETTGVPSGFRSLDKLTGGWQKSDLIIVAARPGMGKTSFVLSLARNAAIDFNRPVALFSLEMTNEQLANRFISSEVQISSEKLRTGNLSQEEWMQLTTRLDKLSQAPIYFDDTPALNIFELRAKCRRLHAQKKIELIIIDYLQLMSGSMDNRSGNREQEISNISRALKSIAKELNTPVIALSQLSRAVETRGGNRRPQLSDLRESGAIEQDADLVIFLYRPEYYKLSPAELSLPDVPGITEVIIAKHRNGPVKSTCLRFIDEYARFVDIEDGLDYSADSAYMDDSAQPGYKILNSRISEFNDEDEPF